MKWSHPKMRLHCKKDFMKSWNLTIRQRSCHHSFILEASLRAALWSFLKNISLCLFLCSLHEQGHICGVSALSLVCYGVNWPVFTPNHFYILIQAFCLCVFNVSFSLNLWCESVVGANFHVFMLKINWRWYFVPGLSVLCATSLVFSLRDACGPFCYPSVPPPFKEPCIVVHIRPYQVLCRVGVYRLLLRCIDCSSIALSDHAPGARGPARTTGWYRRVSFEVSWGAAGQIDGTGEKAKTYTTQWADNHCSWLLIKENRVSAVCRWNNRQPSGGNAARDPACTCFVVCARLVHRADNMFHRSALLLLPVFCNIISNSSAASSASRK